MSVNDYFEWPSKTCQEPLEYIHGKMCEFCMQDATCAILSDRITPVCEKHGRLAKVQGWDVVFPPGVSATEPEACICLERIGDNGPCPVHKEAK
jgi:hypothetical protein